MGTSKGTDLIALRRLLHDRGPETEDAYLSGLPSDLRVLFLAALTTSRVPIEQVSALFEPAARLLFTGHPRPDFQLGRLLSQNSFRGVYRILLRITSVKFLITQAAQLWTAYHDQGTARVENFAERSLDFVVVGYPELPGRFGEGIAGSVAGILELHGLTEVDVVLIEHDTRHWRWRASWR